MSTASQYLAKKKSISPASMNWYIHSLRHEANMSSKSLNEDDGVDKGCTTVVRSLCLLTLSFICGTRPDCRGALERSIHDARKRRPLAAER